MTQVFISYSRKDLEFVQRLADDLIAAGLEVWYDLSGLEAGSRWGGEIQKAIKASQYFIVILSSNSIASEWVEKEFLYADNLKLKIIPILYQPCEIPMWFINLHFIDMQVERDYPKRVLELLKLMGIKPAPLEKKVPELAPKDPVRPDSGPDKVAQFPWNRRWGAWLGIGGGILILITILTFSILWMQGKFRSIQPTASPDPGAILTEIPPNAIANNPTGDNSITIGEVESFASLDPININTNLEFELLRNTGETLVVRRPGSTELIPGLAASMPVISQDGLTYTFALRPGVRFSDGLELNAQLYAAQLDRLLKTGPSCEYGMAGSMVVPYLESITATDDMTMVFQLTKPYGYFLQFLELPIFSPSHPDLFPSEECVQIPPAPIPGVGPWFISQYDQDGVAVLEPNPYYLGELPGQVDQVIVRSYPDTQSLAQAVLNGEVDIAWNFYYTMQAEVQKMEELTIETVQGGSLFSIVINHTTAPTDDPNVYKAIASAIDRTAIANQVYTGNAIPLYSPLPPGMPGAKDVFGSSYPSPDQEAARLYLAASGYDENNKCEINIY